METKDLQRNGAFRPFPGITALAKYLKLRENERKRSIRNIDFRQKIAGGGYG
jgi:hypothetical protein